MYVLVLRTKRPFTYLTLAGYLITRYSRLAKPIAVDDVASIDSTGWCLNLGLGYFTPSGIKVGALLPQSWSWAMKIPALKSKASSALLAASTSYPLHTSPVLIRRSHRFLESYTKNTASIPKSIQIRNVSDSTPFKMSQKPFSNTEVPSDKPADPYTATNKSEPELKEKVQDLVTFIESCKFGMMTTRIGSSGLLTSRCMALAAKVGLQLLKSPLQISP